MNVVSTACRYLQVHSFTKTVVEHGTDHRFFPGALRLAFDNGKLGKRMEGYFLI